MATRLMSAEQVKQFLNVSDFRHLTKEKLIQFVSAIPEMDKDVAIEAIQQFPEFSSCAKVMVTHYKEQCDAILNENCLSSQNAMNGYQTILDALCDLTRSKDISPEERRDFAEKMVEIADKMAALDSRNKEFHAGMAKNTSCLAGFVVLIFGMLLGIKISGTDIPHIS